MTSRLRKRDVLKMNKKINIAFYILLFAIVIFLIIEFTKTNYIAERELPYYCLYQWEDEITVTVHRKGNVMVEKVICNTERAEKYVVEIGFRSLVYWGYRGHIPFPSTYAKGEDAPKMTETLKDNYGIARILNMFGRDYNIFIYICDVNGNVLWQNWYHP